MMTVLRQVAERPDLSAIEKLRGMEQALLELVATQAPEFLLRGLGVPSAP